MFIGAMTALVTPFRDGRIDAAAIEALVEAQIAGGIDALVPCGTTGESATLSHDEHAEVVRLVVQAARHRVPVIAGAGSNSTAEAIALSRAAKQAGADGLLHITPYYNKPTQEGLYQHFRAVVEAVGLPTVLYNVPGRTGCDLAVETLARLCELDAVVAVKEATGQVVRAQQIVSRLGDRLVVLSGEDAINYPLYCIGARGCISVVSNVAPKLVAEAWDAHAAGDAARARALHYRSLPLADALFVETNPIPVKAAVAMILGGRMTPEIRLPLVPISAAARERLSSVLRDLSLT
jgi:4-hydroxy-tetrahydrodipicolinate synthase